MPLSPDEIGRLKALKDKGLSLNQIARICKVSRTTVRRHTDLKYEEYMRQANLRRWHKDRLDPEKVAKYKAYRKELYDRTGR